MILVDLDNFSNDLLCVFAMFKEFQKSKATWLSLPIYINIY